MTASGDDYKVELEEFAGPLDLLLYLVRKEEVELEALPIARLTEQYLRYIEKIDDVDLDRAGDFLVMAAQLLEWKARALLPDPAAAAPVEEPGRSKLVDELLEYRDLKERARLLSDKADERARRFERESPRTYEDAESIKNADIWDLVTAFQRLELAIGLRPEERVLEADEAPLAFFVEGLRAHLAGSTGPVRFSSLFTAAQTRTQLVATFLALLELIRLGEARARQEAAFQEIVIERRDAP